MNKDFLVYDIESQRQSSEVEGKWKNIEGFGFASGVVYDSRMDQYVFFGPGDIERDRCCAYLSDSNVPVIGFNSVKFDSVLMLGNDRRLVSSNSLNEVSNGTYSWHEIDLFLELVVRIYNSRDYVTTIDAIKSHKIKIPKGALNLEGVCGCTLNVNKSGVGLDGPEFFRTNQYHRLFEYNLHDVRLTKKLFEFIREHKYVITGTYDVVKF